MTKFHVYSPGIIKKITPEGKVVSFGVQTSGDKKM